jgi:flagellar protein FlgJ
MNGPNSLAGVGAVAASPAAHHASNASNAKFHRAAQQFQAMFMGEMLRMARPVSKATGVFAAGDGEKVWQGFMDQALGDAVAANGNTGLTSVIEKALNAAAHQPPGADQ